jgi:hypothetical protein
VQGTGVMGAAEGDPTALAGLAGLPPPGGHRAVPRRRRRRGTTPAGRPRQGRRPPGHTATARPARFTSGRSRSRVPSGRARRRPPGPRRSTQPPPVDSDPRRRPRTARAAGTPPPCSVRQAPAGGLDRRPAPGGAEPPGRNASGRPPFQAVRLCSRVRGCRWPS